MEKLVIKIPRKYIFGLVLLAVLAFSSLPHRVIALHGGGPPEDLVAVFTDQQNDLLNALNLLTLSDFDGIPNSNEKAVLLAEIRESYDLVSQALTVEPKDKNWADSHDYISQDADSAIKSFNANKSRLKIGSSVSLNKEKAAEILRNPSNYSEEEIAQAGAVLDTATGMAERNNKVYETPINCSGWWNFWNSPGTCFLLSVGDKVLWLFAKLLFLAGILFDFSIQFGIFKIKEFFSGSGINTVWSTVRDLGNIVFIFFLLWLSIQTILGLGDGKKALPGIIIAALLINFSMFFTRVIIDTSNIVALQFYNGIVSSPTCITAEKYDGCVSDKLMAATNLSSIYDFGKSGEVKAINVDLTVPNIIIVTVFGSIFYLIAAFILLQAAFLFIARTVAFVMLAMISPIAFIFRIIPKTKHYADEWWKAIINQALVAPVFLLFLWIIIKLTEGAGGTLFGKPGESVGTNSTLANTLTSGGGMSLIFGFFFLIGLLYFALKITKEYSGTFGTAAVDFGGKALGMIGGGAGGWMLRGTAGKAMNWAANNKTLQDWGAKDRFGVGNALHKFTVAGAKSSYDLRAGVPIVGDVAGSILKQSGANVDFGKAGGKGGYRADLESEVKERKSYGKELDQKYNFTGARMKIAAGEMTEADMAKQIKETSDANKERQRVYRESGLPDATIIERMVGKRRKSTVLSMSGAADIEASNQLQKEAFDKGKKKRDKDQLKAKRDQIETLKRQRDIALKNSKERDRLDKEISDLEKDTTDLEEGIKSEDIKEAAKAAAEEAVKGSGDKKEKEEKPKEEK